MAIARRRKKEIIDLATPGVPPGTPEELWNDDAALVPLIRAADKKRLQWLKTTSNSEELHCFAENWRWDGGGGRPLQALIKNQNCDAGTMLMIYWIGCAEDYYFQYNSINDTDSEFERENFRLLLQIEKRIVNGNHKNANISFDPKKHISMFARRDEFEREIPEIMYTWSRGPRGFWKQ